MPGETLGGWLSAEELAARCGPIGVAPGKLALDRGDKPAMGDSVDGTGTSGLGAVLETPFGVIGVVGVSDSGGSEATAGKGSIGTAGIEPLDDSVPGAGLGIAAPPVVVVTVAGAAGNVLEPWAWVPGITTVAGTISGSRAFWHAVSATMAAAAAIQRIGLVVSIGASLGFRSSNRYTRGTRIADAHS